MQSDERDVHIAIRSLLRGCFSLYRLRQIKLLSACDSILSDVIGIERLPLNWLIRLAANKDSGIAFAHPDLLRVGK